jgi:hypothetical protein
VALAQELVRRSQHDTVQQEWLQLTAHRILQELLLTEKTPTSATCACACADQAAVQKEEEEDVTTTTTTTTTFKSPYRTNYNAEEGESAFEIFRKLMDTTQTKETYEQRRALFGSPMCDRLAKACSESAKSSVLYSPTWSQHQQSSSSSSSLSQQRHDSATRFKDIPGDLLLLCLHGNRMARADASILRRVVSDFDLWNLLIEILDGWGGLDSKEWFADLLVNVQQTNNNGCQSSSLSSSSNAATKPGLHSLLFVCRSYRRMNALQWTNIRGSLARKVQRCLQILREYFNKNNKTTTTTTTTTQVVVPTTTSSGGVATSAARQRTTTSSTSS